MAVVPPVGSRRRDERGRLRRMFGRRGRDGQNAAPASAPAPAAPTPAAAAPPTPSTRPASPLTPVKGTGVAKATASKTASDSAVKRLAGARKAAPAKAA